MTDPAMTNPSAQTMLELASDIENQARGYTRDFNCHISLHLAVTSVDDIIEALRAASAPAAVRDGLIHQKAYELYPQSNGTHRQAFIAGAKWVSSTPEESSTAAGEAKPFGYLMEKAGINNGYYFHSPAEFEHVEERFRQYYIPVYRAAVLPSPQVSESG